MWIKPHLPRKNLGWTPRSRCSSTGSSVPPGLTTNPPACFFSCSCSSSKMDKRLVGPLRPSWASNLRKGEFSDGVVYCPCLTVLGPPSQPKKRLLNSFPGSNYISLWEGKPSFWKTPEGFLMLLKLRITCVVVMKKAFYHFPPDASNCSWHHATALDIASVMEQR